MDMNTEDYKKYAKAHAPKSPVFKNCIKAFLVGGIICTLSQGLRQLYGYLLGVDTTVASALASITLAFVAIVLTALGVFDNIAKHAGAGTLVPITGFANAVSSPAIDSKAEGLVLGVGTKIFSVAGPVILYGTLTGVIYGLIYYVYLCVVS
ncbi:MAG: SpoVA/SpoVAEb family sporulation membrane protein [Ruminococcaceae bacterium]|nr:SpoVA/SpoVAEb family sporulation membrane protein [Oscillospiraceae bacterium]